MKQKLIKSWMIVTNAIGFLIYQMKSELPVAFSRALAG